MVEIEAGTRSNVVMQGGKSVAKSGASHMVDSVAVETVGCKVILIVAAGYRVYI